MRLTQYWYRCVQRGLVPIWCPSKMSNLWRCILSLYAYIQVADLIGYLHQWLSQECNMENTNWKLCFICQTATNENVGTDPATSEKSHGQPDKLVACYQELLSNISKLYRIGELPNFVSVASSYICGCDDNKCGGGASVEQMIAKHASWHKIKLFIQNILHDQIVTCQLRCTVTWYDIGMTWHITAAHING